MSFVVAIPLRKPLPSAANLREHWAAKAKRVKSQRHVVRLAFGLSNRRALHAQAEAYAIGVWDKSATLRVRFVRVASRRLDDDNLGHAFKAMRDEVAAMAGVDDGNSLWRWEYAQETGKPGVRIEVGE